MAQQLVTLFLLILLSLTQVAANVFAKSRRDALELLGNEKEVQLYFIQCSQSSLESACLLAMDSSYSQEPSQCAITEEQDNPYWVGYLEQPAFVTEVTILSVDQTYGTIHNGMSNMIVELDDRECFYHVSPETFVKRTFPCDAPGSKLAIKSSSKGVLAICQIDVIGVQLKLPDVLEDRRMLPISICKDSKDSMKKCRETIDNQTSTCVTDNGGEAFSSPIFAYLLPVLSVIDEVHVYTPANQNPPKVILDGFACQNIGGTDPIKFNCRSTLSMIAYVLGQKNASITVCEVQLLGYRTNYAEPQAYRYIGCFVDKPEDRDFSQLASRTLMSLKRCYKVCKRLGSKYFGLQAGKLCYCGDSHGKHGKTDDASCEQVCEKGEKDFCGGKGTNRVYEILSGEKA